MIYQVPLQPKIYHIVHLNNLEFILSDSNLWSDFIVKDLQRITTIGMSTIKQRRLTENKLSSHPQLFVGECVPFYFCPRSIMLFLIYCANHIELTYKGGQQPIIHLVSDLEKAVQWANKNNKKWAFTLSNAGAYYFEDRANLGLLNEINWPAVQTDKWSGEGIPSSVKEGKQAEFLIEEKFPWQLVECIGVYSTVQQHKVNQILHSVEHRPSVRVMPSWYY